jgi:hypothetical protein
VKRRKSGKCRPCPVFASYTLAFALQLRKNCRKTSVRVKTLSQSRKTAFRVVSIRNTKITISKVQNPTAYILCYIRLLYVILSSLTQLPVVWEVSVLCLDLAIVTRSVIWFYSVIAGKYRDGT